ncbi:RES family NAD+ phosphorylase [Cupriavidus sp. D39]|uniref:RES family NAD+ phosphorylase n=1 Tax=Cupriavidus sp. D39 TaxID=2997877 RepID=UPI00226E6912|nr:RES family NAD+ phosphorylase [Cupriavidus sp. D39]MCY0854896.1 RES family NAD+ phosphorylase [Cupriavidus sp. D39]
MTFSAEDLGCPLPPADLADRRLTTKMLDLERVALWRIHRAHLDPIYYNRRAPGVTHYRFDAAGGEFGVLYAAPSFAACMAEAVIRERFQGQHLPLLLDEHELSSRCICRLAVADRRPLVLADLTGPLTTVGMDARVFSVTDYLGPNLWSSALHAAFPRIDGLYFQSRLAGSLASLSSMTVPNWY